MAIIRNFKIENNCSDNVSEMFVNIIYSERHFASNYLINKYENLYDADGNDRGRHLVKRDVLEILNSDISEEFMRRSLKITDNDDYISALFYPDYLKSGDKHEYTFDCQVVYFDMIPYYVVYHGNRYGGWYGSVASNLSGMVEDELGNESHEYFFINKRTTFEREGINGFIEVLFVDGSDQIYGKYLNPRIALTRSHEIDKNTCEISYRRNIKHFPKLNNCSDNEKVNYMIGQLNSKCAIRKRNKPTRAKL